MVQIKKQLINDTPYKFGISNEKAYITIHETANISKGANAQAHANLQSNGNSRGATWHWQVDDTIAIQSFDHKFQLFHGGDGTRDKNKLTPFIDNGNLNSIAIEICVNSDGDYKKAVQNAVELTKIIMAQEDIPIENVVQHNYWSGKNCPTYLRDGRKGVNWNDFIRMLKEEKAQQVSKPKAKTLYRVRKSVNDSQSQLGAYSILDNAKLMAENNKGYKVFDTNGKLIFDPHKKSQSKPQPKSKKLAVGDKVILSKSATKYATGQSIPSFVKGKKYTIMQLKSDRALLREIMSWVYLKDIGGNASTPSKPKPKSTTKKEYVQLPASAKTWKTYRLNVQPIARNSDWSLTPSRFGGLTYEVLGEPYPHVVTIMTGKGKRNIYVAPSTSARRYKK